ncbi:MAG: hypothetical protein ACJA01_002520 [Saprospiraceae bacterium]|jgi:hypothetical protein
MLFLKFIATAAFCVILVALGFAQPDMDEKGSRLKDQVILDDLIVDGSACVGMDCVNGESFGFSTIKLKENNLRIKFEDTSNSSSFPTRDWELEANSSSNGGTEHFAINDIDGGRTPFKIIAGAPTNSLFVSSLGRLGLGTGTPLVDVHVKSGNTPTLRLEQDGSSGFTSQTWDVGGNETNFFVRDATNRSLLPFKIVPNAPNSSLHIAANGDIGLGTSTPDGQLDIAHSSNANNHALFVDPYSNVGINIDNGGSVNGLFDVQNSGTSLLMVKSDGDVGIGTSSPGAQLHIAVNTGVDAFLINNDVLADSALLVVKADGKVGIGTASPAGALHVELGDNDFFVGNDGNVGIGMINPTYDLHINRTVGNAQLTLQTSATSANAVQFRMQTDNTNRRIIAINSAGVQQSQIGLEDAGVISFYAGDITTYSRVSAGSTALTASSSRNLKSNIANLEVPDILKKISLVPVTTYNWKEELVGPEIAKREIVGLIAQDFYTVLNKGNDIEINGQDVQMALWMGVQELYKDKLNMQTQLDEKEERITKLENQISFLIDRFEQLKDINVEIEDIKTGFIKQNTPNPFKDETLIAYNIPTTANSASLQVININGQLIKKVPITNFGTGTIRLNASSLPSGTYTYSLIVDEKVIETKKMVSTK